jgi:hypothetical protein
MGYPSDISKSVARLDSFHLEFCWMESPGKMLKLERAYDSAGLAVSSTYFLESKVWVTNHKFNFHSVLHRFHKFSSDSTHLFCSTLFSSMVHHNWVYSQTSLSCKVYSQTFCHVKVRNLWSGSFWCCSNYSIVLKFIPLSLCGLDRSFKFGVIFCVASTLFRTIHKWGIRAPGCPLKKTRKHLHYKLWYTFNFFHRVAFIPLYKI